MRRAVGRAGSLAGAALALAVAGCATSTSIADLRADEARCRDHAVTLRGTVAEHLDLAITGTGYYQLRDDSGQIWVRTSDPLPPAGERLRVTGTCAPGLRVGSLELGLVLHERSRR